MNTRKYVDLNVTDDFIKCYISLYDVEDEVLLKEM